MKIGVVGFGYWGPNIVRNFNNVKGASVEIVCDKSKESQKKAKKVNNNLQVTQNYLDITQSAKIDAVAVVTPVSTHYEIAKSALENGKHVFVEKPFAANTRHAVELIELAEKMNLTIMVDHTFLFTGAVRKIKQLLENDILGKIYYYDSTRVNLGLFQHDINVIWDLAPHDLSIMDYVLDSKPVAISANGIDHLENNLENIAYLTVYFEENIIAQFNLDWLSPVKIRSTLIGGDKKMLAWNDLEADEKIKIYDKGVEINNAEGIHNLLVSYRTGDMFSPKIESTEALKVEAQYFVDCINNGERPFNDGVAGLEVVKMLEASDESLKNKGKIIQL